MKVVHLSSYDLKGGAAISARRLHCGLQRIGHDSSMFVRFRSSQDPAVGEYVIPESFDARWRRWIRRRAIVQSAEAYLTNAPKGFELFSDDRTPFGATVIDQVRPCDVMHLHWVAAYLDYEQCVPAALARGPLVWTLHDMNMFTGGCHYDMGCGRWASKCGGCPQLGSQDPMDLAAQIWERKQQVFQAVDPARFCIVTPSRWLSRTVGESPIFQRFRVETIPYGLDLDDFAPRERAAARDVLGIPAQARVLLFLAETVDNRRKGFVHLTEALEGLAGEFDQLWLLSVGNNPPKLDRALQGSHLSYVGNDRFLSLAYSAADAFVIPSMQDNLPNTVMEAMACGIPVVGFDVGGIRDMVRSERTGVLVPPGDVRALRDAIVRVLKSPESADAMGREGRTVALQEYQLTMQAQRYADLYKDLVA